MPSRTTTGSTRLGSPDCVRTTTTPRLRESAVRHEKRASLQGRPAPGGAVGEASRNDRPLASSGSGGDSVHADFFLKAPSLTLPKGGGAIRGMGEKFSANPVTGTGSMSVPIATSPGRAGFGPQFALTTTPVPATGRSAWAGRSRCRRSRARPTRARRSIWTTSKATPLSSRAPRIWCRCSTPMARGPHRNR